MVARDDVLAIFRDEGFDVVRVAQAAGAALAPAREAALAAQAGGLLDGMDWITPDWLTRATEPERFLPGARSVVLVALAYAPGPVAGHDVPAGTGRIAAYAAGRDYHRVFEKRLRRAARRLRQEHGARARPTV